MLFIFRGIVKFCAYDPVSILLCRQVGIMRSVAFNCLSNELTATQVLKLRQHDNIKTSLIFAGSERREYNVYRMVGYLTLRTQRNNTEIKSIHFGGFIAMATVSFLKPLAPAVHMWRLL